MRLLAVRQSVLLSVMFLAVYGGSNWLAAQRTDVGVWYFDWERQLPFWPLMIVPYLSLDAFFLAAPFLCNDREELRLFSRRIVLAIVAAGICFVGVPLRLAVDRPVVDGWLGSAFNAFVALDQPFNLFPSLHITLAIILADTYRRHTKGIVRLAALTWFALICASTLLTNQHHVIDIVGGLALAALIFYAVREGRTSDSRVRNLRVALGYLLGASAAAVVAVVSWPWGALMVWPAFSLALVSAGYCGAGPWIFAKSNGKIPLSTWIVVWPHLVGQWLSLAYYRRHCRPYDVVAPGIWIGRRLDEQEAAKAVEAGVSAVIDLTADLDEVPSFRNIAYRNIQTLDLTALSADALDEAVGFMTDHIRRGVVFVHCKVGYSRCVSVAGAYLLASGLARTTDDALDIIRAARPQIVARPEAVASLRDFEARLTQPTARPVKLALRLSVVSFMLGRVARLLCGPSRWLGTGPISRQRIYFANHTSHLDFLALWGSLPPEVRVETRPVAGRDYWDRDPVRRYVARRVLRAVLVDRPEPGTDRENTIAIARRSVDRCARALAAGSSLIIFPEGTRGSGETVGPFKSGLYHLCRLRPDVELVPVSLENLHRILPKGECVPLPLSGSVTFGQPTRLLPGEEKNAFLARLRAALIRNGPCTSESTVMSRAS
jgi:1-acyl-sn-glycerol-3-phosphate acyltransferase/membrane-associated phospholipid phosphatase